MTDELILGRKNLICDMSPSYVLNSFLKRQLGVLLIVSLDSAYVEIIEKKCLAVYKNIYFKITMLDK